jgi:hypothetical protein
MVHLNPFHFAYSFDSVGCELEGLNNPVGYLSTLLQNWIQ